jgi:hypothetical protein
MRASSKRDEFRVTMTIQAASLGGRPLSPVAYGRATGTLHQRAWMLANMKHTATEVRDPTP